MRTCTYARHNCDKKESIWFHHQWWLFSSIQPRTVWDCEMILLCDQNLLTPPTQLFVAQLTFRNHTDRHGHVYFCCVLCSALNYDLSSNLFSATWRVVALDATEHLMVWKLVNSSVRHQVVQRPRKRKMCCCQGSISKPLSRADKFNNQLVIEKLLPHADLALWPFPSEWPERWNLKKKREENRTSISLLLQPALLFLWEPYAAR